MLTLHLSAELQMAGVTQAIDFKTGRRRRTRLLVRCTHNSKMLIIGSLKYYEGFCICNWDLSSCIIKVLMYTFGEGRKSGQKLHILIVHRVTYRIVQQYIQLLSVKESDAGGKTAYSLNNDSSIYLFFIVMKQNPKVNINQINSPTIALKKKPKNKKLS